MFSYISFVNRNDQKLEMSVVHSEKKSIKKLGKKFRKTFQQKLKNRGCRIKKKTVFGEAENFFIKY